MCDEEGEAVIRSCAWVSHFHHFSHALHVQLILGCFLSRKVGIASKRSATLENKCLRKGVFYSTRER